MADPLPGHHAPAAGFEVPAMPCSRCWTKKATVIHRDGCDCCTACGEAGPCG